MVVLALTGLNYLGLQKSTWLTSLIVAITLIVLVLAVAASASGGTATAEHLLPFPGAGPGAILESAGLLFFAFAGYARIATLGGEVRDPQRTIGTAVAALGSLLALVLGVSRTSWSQAGTAGVNGKAHPLKRGSESGGASSLRVGALDPGVTPPTKGFP